MMKISSTKWNLATLFSGIEDPLIEQSKKTIADQTRQFVNKWESRDDYLSDPKILREALDEYETWQENCAGGGKVGYFFNYTYLTHMEDEKIKEKYKQIEEFSIKNANEIQFFMIRLAKINNDVQKKLLESHELEKYKHFLEQIFAEAKYVLSEVEEKVIKLFTPTSYSGWTEMTEEFLAREEREILTEDGVKANKNYNEILSLLSSQKKDVRDIAAKAINDICIKNAELATHEINAVLAYKKINDELRGFERADISTHLGDDVETTVVDALVSAVTQRFDISRKYYELKAKMMGQKKLGYHERSVNYGKIEKTYLYPDAVNLVYKVFYNLDEEFAEILKKIVEEGRVDVYPQKGKSGGAFCSYGSRIKPVLILLNHTDRLQDVLTLAHESGHAINHTLFNKHQNALNTGGSKFTAECASTFMEDFVLQEILKESDDELKLAILMQQLNDQISTIIRQIACYNFEMELHTVYRQKNYLSKEEVGNIFKKHMQSYCGDFVEFDFGNEYWWVYWSHIRYYFYVYSYASGLLMSKSMQKNVNHDKQYLQKIKEFLKAGSSDSPKNIFSKLGIDITDQKFWMDGMEDLDNLLKETEILAKKLGKI